MYIDTQDKLNSFVEGCSDTEYITIDTEFLREKTYYPKLCLLQLATNSQLAIVDPLANVDITALAPLFSNPRVTKVFHAGDQDRAILYNALGIKVTPIFDTQRAVMLLGLPQQLSLSGIVKHFCGISLKKGESFSDWSRRPLTDKQLLYAMDDVRYLPQIYEKLLVQLTKMERLDWLREDLKHLEDSEVFAKDEREAYKRLKGTSSLSNRQLAVAREVCAWREKLAQTRNTPRKWVLADELIVEIAKKMPDTADEVFEIRGIREKLNQRITQELLENVAKAKALPRSEWPTREHSPNYGTGIAPKVDLLSALLHHRSSELHIASNFLTNHEEMMRLASGQRDGLMILKGWRREILGNELLQLLDGKLVLTIDGAAIKVSKSE